MDNISFVADYPSWSRGKRYLCVISLVLSSALFFSIPFLVEGLAACLSLFAFIPLFVLDYICYRNRIRYSTWLFYIIFLLWNVMTTFWVYFATAPGGIAAMVLNAAQMSAVLWLFRVFRRALDKKAGNTEFRVLPYIFFIVLWIAWEFHYFDAQISWPWLILGNSFATCTGLVQWYEYTGVLGGSLWILLAGFVGFHLFFIAYRQLSLRRKVISVSLYCVLMLLPPAVSLYLYNSYEEVQDSREFVVLQPNIDPYSEKFSGLSRTDQDLKLLSLAESAVTDSSFVALAPETFTSYVNEDGFFDFSTVRRLQDFIGKHKSVNFIMGAISLKYYPWNIYPGSTPDSAPTLTAKRGNGYWYDSFNSAFILDSADRYDFFHKSKLVVLAEFVPYPKLFRYLDGLMIELGGTISSYGTQDEVSVFTANDGTKVGTAICYESVYGEYFTQYVKKGAQIMTVITNDGWWRNTPGHRQHLRYASLRAIESRRSIARSANTGISALIDQRGDVLQSSPWWEDAVLRGDLNLNDRITVYVRYGDYIGRAAVFASILFLLLLLSMKVFPAKRQ